ncbi:FACT complex subunit pob3 [Delitschia confertaspora ATCC 74209]|uniref:FACT complex subunit POB3 n=1 Tax=Delitschia confertaspora ATCC 74209 TaxID=1513339 RepID=A0A9P4JNB9_9PLEO|nr:FACT complex subunit pob3 [Delitschia confertaspora ATCC 74209]
MEAFQEIYLNLSKKHGVARFAESGWGWKPSGGGDTFTLDQAQIMQTQWSRAARGYELKMLTRTDGVIQLDGFQQEDFERISKLFKIWYGINVEHREHSLRGWNWGKAEFGKAELSFMVANRPAFEIPYTEVSNTNLAGKNEVAVDFSVPADGDDTGTNGHLGGARARGKKSSGARDQLVEMRFYVPGTASRKEKKEDGEDVTDNDDVEEQNAAQLFYETMVDKAEIGEVAGDTYASFQDILHLTPRGRFDIDFYEKSFRLRGKTYDYKIQYDAVKKFMVLPKPDDIHTLITVGLDPPLRQGQTRYPFLVMQFKRDEETNIDLNMTEEQLAQYDGKLQPRYEAPISVVISDIFRGLTNKRITKPSKDFLSHHEQSGVKCSIKANEGHLFCLDKAFMFVPKPATYISMDNIASVTMSRVGGAMTASRTFDIAFTMKGGLAEHQFSNINREEQQPLENFFRLKGIKTKNEMADESSAILAAALQDDDLASSDDGGANRGSADEDDESVDEDFQAESESDVAEEYDEDHKSSGSDDSDAEMEDADDDAAPDEEPEPELVERPKKKVKTSK